MLNSDCLREILKNPNSYSTKESGETSKIFRMLTPFWGEMMQFDLRIFLRWVAQPPSRLDLLDGK